MFSDILLGYMVRRRPSDHISIEVGKRLVKTQDVHSIEWLAADYNNHLLHHMHHLLELEPVVYR